MNKKTILIACAIFGLIGVVAAAAGYYIGKSGNVAVSSAPTVNSEPIEEEVAAEVAEEVEQVSEEVEPVALKTVTEGVNWLSAPEKIEQPDIYLSGDQGQYYSYYKVADLSDGGEIIAEVIAEMGTFLNYYQVDANNNYSLLANNTDEYTVENAPNVLKPEVKINREVSYTEISDPESIEINNIKLVKSYSFSDNEFFGDQENSTGYTRIGETENGIIYERIANFEVDYNKGAVKGKTYTLVSADSTMSTYANSKPFLADDGSLQLNFTDTEQVYKDTMFMSGISLNGCGSGGADHVLPANIPSQNLKEIGKSTDGDSIYRLQYEQTDVFDVAYGSYSLGRSAEYGNAPISRDEYNKNAIILVWKDPAGDYIGFISSDYAPNVECGKPVVYLYPETTTNVTVEVDAKVTISEPAYYNSDYNNMLGGWRTVAQPNGQLTMPNGDVLGSLYWEGKGFGTYPAITQGRVIESKNFEAEVRADMTKLGLNVQEQQDFVDFWQDYVPTQKYTRLSWLDTRAMDALAPLHISPKPGTVKRVFLDFAGQTSPETDLQLQVLTGFERKGFTVVEWGGLLVGGLK